MRHVGSLALVVFGAALLGTAACEGGSPEPASPDSGALDSGVFDDATDTAPDTVVAEDGAADAIDAPPGEIPIDPKVLAAIPGKDAIAGTHWRSVGGPKTFPEAGAAFAAVGDALYLSTVRGLRKTTGTGWTDVAPRACRFAPSANGALLCLADDGATFDRFDGTTWTTHACPSGGCTTYGSLIETGTGTIIYVPYGAGGIVRRRAAGSTTWTDVTGVPSACLGASPAVSASGARVVVDRCRSFDDGLSFALLPAITQAVATSAGILASGPSGVSLHTPIGVTTTLSSSASLTAGDTRVTAWTSAGTLQVSTDGGATWTVRAGSSAPMYVSRGVLAYPLSGKFNPRIDEVRISTDDGVSFKSISVPRGTNAFGGAYRASTKEIFTADIAPTIFTADALRLHRSTDGGATWTAVAFPYWWRRYEGGYGGDFNLLLASPGGQVFAGSFGSFTRFDDAAGAFVEEPALADRSISAAAGKLFLPSTRRFSTDDGKTWSAVVDKGWNRPGGLDAVGVAWSRKENYDADWPTTIERSTDGVTWVATGSLDGRLLGVTFDRTLVGWAGSPRALHRSTDRGVSWSKLTISASESATTLLPLGGSSTLVLVVDDAKGFTVQMSNDGGVTFVDRTLDLPGRPDSFFAGNGHVWATVPDYGMFELVGP